ncbi:MAG: ABC transporter substrate-binding protein [Syntrophomonadaceae bacterium]|nr:ABC transporter substrate-binding protein [Syntrophomonadaceae bacterium]
MKKKLFIIVCVISLLVTIFAISGCGTQQKAAAPTPAPAGPTKHTVVGLLPLTGALSTFGENSSKVAALAAADVNAWLEKNNKNWRLELVIDDCATDPPTGLRKATSWYGKGVRFFVGPQSSGVAREVLAFANANKIIFSSPSSTAPGLAIPGDWLFRFCPSDAIQGPALARLIQDAGIEHLIFIWRGDTWGDGLKKATEDALKNTAVKIYPQQLRYDPTLEAFTVQAALLNDYVKDLVAKKVPLNKIGVAIVAFEEIAPFFTAANAHPQLRKIGWFGTDGTAMSAALLKDATAGKFAIDTKFASTKTRPEAKVAQSNYDRVRQHVQQVLNRDTDAYSYNTYDIVWSYAMAIDEVGYDAEKVKAILPRVADERSKTYGASGHVVLNEAGDRAFADYNVWVINDKREWENVGHFDSRANEIKWVRKLY